jgi:hypothetical protein
VRARSVDQSASDVERRLRRSLKSLPGTDVLQALGLPLFSPYDA